MRQVEFGTFLSVLSNLKTQALLEGDDEERAIVDAFVAMGGNADRTGAVSSRLIEGQNITSSWVLVLFNCIC